MQANHQFSITRHLDAPADLVSKADEAAAPRQLVGSAGVGAGAFRPAARRHFPLCNGSAKRHRNVWPNGLP
ncbi:MAG: hypothetical protein IPN76_33580 [Saprospiraceae bacterium]|nr:hypothetical protein [Saprospiraceae bacterium]